MYKQTWAVRWQVVAGERWITVRLCNMVGTREVKNKCTTGYKRGEVTFQVAYWSRINLVCSISIDWGTHEWWCQSAGSAPTSPAQASGLCWGSTAVPWDSHWKLRVQGLPVSGTEVPPALKRRRRKTGHTRLEPSLANQLLIKHFWSCKNSPCGSRLTFTPGGKLITSRRMILTARKSIQQ